jgi:hypothetical protein
MIELLVAGTKNVKISNNKNKAITMAAPSLLLDYYLKSTPTKHWMDKSCFHPLRTMEEQLDSALRMATGGNRSLMD